MAPASKLLVVVSGFVGAGIAASLVTHLYIASTPDVDRSGGMSAFGDAAYFLAVFAALSVPAACLSLYFLRPQPQFWHVLSTLAVLAGGVTTVAFCVYMIAFGTASRSLLVGLTPLWLLASPILGSAFLLSALFSPLPRNTKQLLASSAVHFALFVCVVLRWMGVGAP